MPKNVAARKEFICTRSKLERLLSEWQKRLRLQDWDIEIKLVRSRELPDHAQASLWTNHDHRMAEITIIEPADYQGGEEWPQDMEASMVHELVHLCWWFLPTIDHEQDSIRYSLEEQAVETLALSLIDLRRKNDKNDKSDKS